MSDGTNKDDELTLSIDTPADISAPVEIVIDGEEGDGGTPVVAKAPEVKQDQTAEAVESLKKQVEALEHGKREAERIAREKAAEAAGARAETQTAHYQTIQTALESVERASERLSESYATALETGDYKAAAKINTEIAKLETRRMTLERGKTQIEDSRPLTEGAVEQPQVQRTVDPVEQFTGSLSSASAAWVRAHPDCVTDTVLNSEMIAAHNRAIRDGIKVDTPEYFGFIEKRLGFAADDAPVVTKVTEPVQRRAAIAAAPVSRGSVSMTSGETSRSTVTLSPAQQEIAAAMGMTNKEYAMELVAIEREKRAG